MSQSRSPQSHNNVDDAVCRYYETADGCSNGRQCPYKHVERGRYTEKTMIVPINDNKNKDEDKDEDEDKKKVRSQDKQASNWKVTAINYTNGNVVYPGFHLTNTQNGNNIPLNVCGIIPIQTQIRYQFIPIIVSSPSPSVSYQQINNNIYNNSSNDSYNSSNRSKWINGTVFYSQIYDKLDDYKDCRVDPSAFIYDMTQRTLVCGECDFSFTVELIRKRGGIGCGNNICSTSWYYYKKQWYHAIPKAIGYQQFGYFIQNLQFCRDNNVKITFGIDAKLLKASKKQWNKIGADKFDRIIFTFPRMYKKSEHQKWAKIKYNHDNETMLWQILKSMKAMLSADGEIHIMLFEGQFCNWNVKKMLNELDLEVLYWTELDQILLNKHFPSFIPRDGYGNPIKLDNTNMHFISININ